MSISVKLALGGKDILLNCEKALSDKNANNCIPALLKNNQYVFKPLGGVIDYENIPNEAKKIKLCGITEFFWNDDAWDNGKDACKIPLGDITLGYYFHGKYFIAINPNTEKPIHWHPR